MYLRIICLCFFLSEVSPWCLKTIFAGDDKVNSIDFSPDGQYILTAHQSEKLLLWNAKTLEILHTYDFGDTIYEAVFSKKSNVIAIGGDSDDVHIVSANDLTYIDSIDTDQDQVHDLDFQYADDRLMTCGQDKKLRFWKTSDWSSANPTNSKQLKHEIYTCQYGDDESRVGAGRHFIESFNPSYPLNQQFQIHNDGTYDDFYAARIRPGSNYAILADDGGKFLQIQLDNSPSIQFFNDHSGSINALGYSRDATYFIAAGSDTKVYIYNGTNRVNKLVQVIDTNSPSSIISARFSYDSNYFAVGNQNGTIYLYQRFCQGCPVGTFRSYDQCKLCTIPLVGCAVCRNQTVCIGCFGGYYLDGQQCKSCDIMQGCAVCQLSNNCSQCLVGFYLDGIICKRCLDNHDGCYQCLDANTCYQCDFNYYLDSSTNTCVSCFEIENCIFCNSTDYCFDCLAGYYQDNGQCISCPQNCKICQSSINCTQCIGGFFPSSGICSKCTEVGCLFCNTTDYCFDCEQDYYASSGSCLNCIFPCSTCNSSSQCHSCVVGYYISSGGVCSNCPSGCLSCNTTTFCHSCDIGYYLDTGTDTCKSCNNIDQHCRECNSSICLSCQIQYYYDSGNSLCALCSKDIDGCQICIQGSKCQFCLVGYYLQTDDSCQSCQVGCQSCKSSTECSICQPGYYSNSQDCLICTNYCLTCLTSTHCQSCPSGMYLDSNICYFCSQNIDNCTSCQDSTHCNSCSLGYYLASATSCSQCTLPCTTCQNTAATCLSCKQGYYLSGNSCQSCSVQCNSCRSSPTTCQSCIIGYYLNTATSTCTQCSVPNCEDCLDATQCNRCINTYYQSSGDCLSCSSLITNCLRCDKTIPTCSLCDYGYHLNSLMTICSLCSISLPHCQHCKSSSSCQTCMSGYYPDSNGDCQSCSTGCFSCLDSVTCQVCIDRYVLDGVACYHCETEIIGCKTCSSRVSCDSCIQGYYKNGNTCQLCRDPIQGCQICSDSSTCILCSLFYQIQSDNTCKLCSQIYNGCQICDGLNDDNNQTGCLQCQIGYYLSYNVSGVCNSCQLSDSGCLKCLDSSICQECMNGYFLSGNNCNQCENVYSHCIYCNTTQCIQCQAGFYLSSGSCIVCPNLGCQICVQSSPNNCLSCNSHYYLSASQCQLCSNNIDYCLQCSDILTCTQCSSGYYVDTNNKCSLCSSTFSGCSICTASGCLDCISNYFVNQTEAIPTCKPCFDFIEGCSYCISEQVCLSCQNGYYYQSSICKSCVQIYGCLYCQNATQCIHCQQGYFLQNSQCFLCSQKFAGCYACDNQNTCNSCQGNFELIGGSCVEIQGEVVRQLAQLQLATYYIDQDTLQNTLYARGDMKYEKIEKQWNKSVELSLISKEYIQTVLDIKQVVWGDDLKSLSFITNNPLGSQLEGSLDQMPFLKTNNRRRLLQPTQGLNYQFKLMMNEQVVHDILPNLDHTGDLYMETPLSDPQFYKSYIQKKNYYYFLFGLFVTIFILTLYIVKVTCLISSTPNKGQIIPHLMAIRAGALALYPSYPEYINFCYGFMSSDFPWANSIFAQLLSDESDVIPEPFEMYYVSLSLSSTYSLALIVIIIVWSLISLTSIVCQNKNRSDLKIKLSNVKSVFYNFFIFGAISVGCLSLQGAILNPISSLSLVRVWYIVGIIMYLGILFQIFYSIFKPKSAQKNQNRQVLNKTDDSLPFNSQQSININIEAFEQIKIQRKGKFNLNKLYKIRVYIKATVLTLLHLNPIYFFICLFSFQIFSIIMQHFLVRKDRVSSKIQTLTQILGDLAIALNIFVPDALIGLILVSLVVLTIIILQIYCIYEQYTVEQQIDGLKIDIKSSIKEKNNEASLQKSYQNHNQKSYRQQSFKQSLYKRKTQKDIFKKTDTSITHKFKQKVPDDTFIFAEL